MVLEPDRAAERRSIESRVNDYVRIAIIAGLAYWSATLIAPFVLIIIWAAILAVTLYPVFQGLLRHLRGRAVLAATCLVLVGLLVIIAPLALASVNLAEMLQTFIAQPTSLELPQAPARLAEIPLLGQMLFDGWNQAARNIGGAIVLFKDPIRDASGIILAKAIAIGGGIVSFIVSIILCGIFLTCAPNLTSGVQLIANRIAGERGIGFARLAGATVRNVSRGVIGVSPLQAVLTGCILIAFSVPGRGALTFGIFILCLIQIGPGLVLFPLLVWSWFAWPTGTAIAFTGLTIPVLVLDNVLKPILFSRGLATPMPVILIGVIGGVIAHGLVGLFVGPIVLGVTYELLLVWVRPSAVSLPVEA